MPTWRKGDELEVEAIVLLLLSCLVLMTMLILRGKKGAAPSVRPLPAFQHMPREMEYAAESGTAVHIALGSGSLYEDDTLVSMAGMEVVASLADAAVAFSAPPVVTVGDPTLLPLAQDALRRAYERHNRIEAYNPAHVRFIAPTPLAYAAGAAQNAVIEGASANFIAGAFDSEVSLLADTGARCGLPQLSAVTTPAAAGVLYPVVDHLAVGEELFAAPAQITGQRRYLLSLMAQDVIRLLIVLAIVGSALFSLLAG